MTGRDAGGRAAQRLPGAKGVRQAVPERFAAGVELYPVGRPTGPVSGPVLLLVGAEDDWPPAGRIRHATAALDPGPVPPVLEVVPGAGHGFDDPRSAEPTRFTYAQAQRCRETGTTVAHSEAAGEAAAERVRAFLEEPLR